MSKEKGKIERKRKRWQEKYGGQFLYFNIFFSVVSIPGVSIIDADGDARIFHAAKKGLQHMPQPLLFSGAPSRA
jgi:hypothetical protein